MEGLDFIIEGSVPSSPRARAISSRALGIRSCTPRSTCTDFTRMYRRAVH